MISFYDELSAEVGPELVIPVTVDDLPPIDISLCAQLISVFDGVKTRLLREVDPDNNKATIITTAPSYVSNDEKPPVVTRCLAVGEFQKRPDDYSRLTVRIAVEERRIDPAKSFDGFATPSYSQPPVQGFMLTYDRLHKNWPLHEVAMRKPAVVLHSDRQSFAGHRISGIPKLSFGSDFGFVVRANGVLGLIS